MITSGVSAGANIDFGLQEIGTGVARRFPQPAVKQLRRSAQAELAQIDARQGVGNLGVEFSRAFKGLPQERLSLGKLVGSRHEQPRSPAIACGW